MGCEGCADLNPDGLFDEIHVVRPERQGEADTGLPGIAGHARVHLHAVAPPPDLAGLAPERAQARIEDWASALVDLARVVRPNLVRADGVGTAAFAALRIKLDVAIPYFLAVAAQEESAAIQPDDFWKAASAHAQRLADLIVAASPQAAKCLVDLGEDAPPLLAGPEAQGAALAVALRQIAIDWSGAGAAGRDVVARTAGMQVVQPAIAPFPEGGSVLCILAAHTPSSGLGPTGVDLVVGKIFGGRRKEAWQRRRDYLVDFYANPRDPAYVVQTVMDLLRANGRIGKVDVAADTAYERVLGASRALFGRIEIMEGRIGRAPEPLRALIAEGRHDLVVLAYPDALGFGCVALEREMLAPGRPQTVVVNGRRRAFLLNVASAQLLQKRRRLSRNRIGELLFAAGILPLAAGWAALDAVTGRSRTARQ